MSITETFLFLFTDSFVAGLVLPGKHALVLPAMQILGGYNLYLAAIIYSFGIAAASPINWFFGKILRSLKKDDKVPSGEGKYTDIWGKLKQHGHWVALLGFVPILGPIVTVFSGLYLADIKKIIGIVFIVNFVYTTGRAAMFW